MTARKKKPAAPKDGDGSPVKMKNAPAPAEVLPAAALPSATPESSPPPPPSDSPPPIAATDEPPPPENPLEALAALDAAATAVATPPASVAAPVPVYGGATDAEAQLSAAVAMNADNAELPKRKGGWPKGKPRSGRSPAFFSPASPIPGGGATADALTVAQLRQRVATLEAQNSEQVKTAMTVGFAQLAKIGFGIVARRNGVHWFLTPEEATEIGDACGQAALPYISYIAPALPFVAAVGAIYGSVSARMEIDTEIQQGKRVRVLPGEVTPNA